ncbi:MAG: hypothetical protein NTZ05_09935, partial [Chloroflexi bacterium]|nr:hypothetical protein [Chloroflexota bacterium]
AVAQQQPPSVAVSAVSTLAAPTLSGPPDGERLPSVGPVTLSWAAPAGSTQLHLQITPANGDGPSINLIRNPDGAFTIPAPPEWYVLLPGLTYTWRVRVSDKAGFAADGDPTWGSWSPERTFRTPPPSSAGITPRSPIDGAEVAMSTPALAWRGAASDLFYYEVQMSGDDRFDVNPATATSFVYWNLVHGGVTTPPDSWRTPALEPNQRYFWRVRPRVQGDGTPVAWGPVWSFTTAAKLDAPPQTPTATVTVTPGGTPGPGSTATPSGTPVPGATGTPKPIPTLMPNRIVFISTRDGSYDVYSMNPDGSNVQRLTSDAAIDARPAWSPDGKKIVWSSFRSGNQQVYMMNADGTKQLRVLPNTDSEYHPNFSADGSLIAFVSNGRVIVADGNGGNARALPETFNNSIVPLFSPNASVIAYVRGQGANYQVCMINVNGAGLYCFTPGDAYAAFHTWSPDGSTLAYAAATAGRNQQIYVVDAVIGAVPIRLTQNSAIENSPAWSPDSKQIAFVSDRDGNLEIYAMNADGTNQRRLTNEAAKDYSPAWSPDGKQILFVSERKGDREIYVMNADGGSPTNLTDNNSLDDSPNWSKQ